MMSMLGSLMVPISSDTAALAAHSSAAGAEAFASAAAVLVKKELSSEDICSIPRAGPRGSKPMKSREHG